MTRVDQVLTTAALQKVARWTRQLRRCLKMAAALHGFQLDERCCFGSAADATKCCRVSNLVAHAIKAALARVDAAHPTRDPRVLAWLDERRAAAAEAGCDEAETRERYLSLHSIGVYVDDRSGASIDDDIYVDQGADADLPLLRGGSQVTRAVLHFEVALMVLPLMSAEFLVSALAMMLLHAVCLNAYVEAEAASGAERVGPAEAMLRLKDFRLSQAAFGAYDDARRSRERSASVRKRTHTWSYAQWSAKTGLL